MQCTPIQSQRHQASIDHRTPKPQAQGIRLKATLSTVSVLLQIYTAVQVSPFRRPALEADHDHDHIVPQESLPLPSRKACLALKSIRAPVPLVFGVGLSLSLCDLLLLLLPPRP
jgi:hypothetical protein